MYYLLSVGFQSKLFNYTRTRERSTNNTIGNALLVADNVGNIWGGVVPFEVERGSNNGARSPINFFYYFTNNIIQVR